MTSLPPTLNATYERILERVNATNQYRQTIVQRTLMWLVNANEKLSSAALCEAISVNLGDDHLDQESIPSEDEILRCCSSLIRLSPDGFELAHFTVKEFLSAIDPKRTPHLAPYVIQASSNKFELAKTCLIYLNFKDFSKACAKTLPEWELLHQKYRFKMHAGKWWSSYCATRLSEDEVRCLLQQLFQAESSGNYHSLVQDQFWDTHNACGFYGAAPFVDVSACSATLGPLHYAAMVGDTELCSWLLENGCLSDGMSDLGQPLHLVLLGRYGSISALQRELNPGVFPPPPLLPPLPRVAAAGPAHSVLDLFIRYGVDLESRLPIRQSSVSELSAQFSPDLLAPLLKAGTRLDGNALRYMLMTVQIPDTGIAKCIGEILQATSMENLLDDDLALYTELSLVAGRTTTMNLQDIADRAMIPRTGSRNSGGYLPALRRAVEYSNLEATKLLLSLYNIDTNQKFDDKRHEATGATILHIAAARSSPKVIEYLLQSGADLQHTTEDGRIPLHFCAYGIDGLACRLLLQRGSDIAKTDHRGWSPWHFASAICNPNMAEALAEHDPDVKSSMARPSVDGCTPIHVLGQLLDAVKPNDLPVADTLEQRGMDMLLVLCKYGANPCIRSKDGSTALHHWALRRHSHSKIAKQLLEEGGDPCAVRNDGMTPLHLLVMNKHLLIGSEKNFKKKLDLLCSEATLNALDKYGSSPLHLFCCTFPFSNIKWDPVGYRMLVSRGADPMLKDGRGKSCFDIASDAIRRRMKSPTCPWYMLEGAAKLLFNILDSVPDLLQSLLRHSAFILRFALRLNRDWFTARVVEKGFDLHARDERGNGDNFSALEFACFTPKSATLMKLILDHAGDVSGLRGRLQGSRVGLVHLACLRPQDQNIQVLDALLDYGLDPDIRCSPEEMTPLMFAASRGKLAHAKSLLDRGADPQAMSGQGFNWNAAHFACQNGHLAILELLLDCHKQNPDRRVRLPVEAAGRKEHDYANLLHIAAYGGKHEVITYLISTCTISNINCRSGLGRTPLHYAVLQGHINSVLVLLSSGADVNASEPGAGCSILHWAAENGHHSIVQMLLNRNCNASAVTRKGLSPHVLAIRGGHKDVAQCIKDHILQKGKKQAPSLPKTSTRLPRGSH